METWLGVGFKPPTKQTAIPLPEIDIAIVVPDDWHEWAGAGNGFGDQVVVFTRVHRDVHSVWQCPLAQLSRPLGREKGHSQTHHSKILNPSLSLVHY